MPDRENYFGAKIVVNPAVPSGTILFRDPETDKIVGRIDHVNIKTWEDVIWWCIGLGQRDGFGSRNREYWVAGRNDCGPILASKPSVHRRDIDRWTVSNTEEFEYR